jgi:hypothetical protein
MTVDLKPQIAPEGDVLLASLASASTDLPKAVLVERLADDFKVEIAISTQTVIRGAARGRIT